MLTFRIVTATHRRPALLRRFLDCLVPQLAERPEFHLVVVNDGSHDDTYQSVVEDFEGAITYLKLPESRGPGPARQAGLDGASEDYLVTTDDDCVPPALWLDRLLGLATTYPHVDLFAGTTAPVDLPRGLIASQIEYVPNSTPAPAFLDARLITAVTANVMFRRETFHNVGGFAPDMRGSEDCYVTQRILKAGGCWLHVPQLETGHRAIQSVGEMWSKFRGYGYHNVQYVIREQDWLVASWLAGTETEGVMEPAWTSAKTQWNKPGNASVAFPQRLLRAALALLAMLAYRRGWRRGTRVFAAHYGRSVPAVPRLSGRFEAFCREIAVPRDT